jgi:uncharacterized protein (DUF2062 family)
MLANLIRATRILLRRALQERSTPRQTGLSVAVGAFSACTPFLGLHIWIALGLATLFRLNRLWAAVGSKTAPVAGVLPLIVFAEVQLAHRLRTGAWLPLAPRAVLAQGTQLLLDWLLGTPIVGGAYAALIGVVAYAIARRRQARFKPSTPGEPLPASSESPPSAPPSPTP